MDVFNVFDADEATRVVEQGVIRNSAGAIRPSPAYGQARSYQAPRTPPFFAAERNATRVRRLGNCKEMHILNRAPASRSRRQARSKEGVRRDQAGSGSPAFAPRPTVAGPMIRLTLFR